MKTRAIATGICLCLAAALAEAQVGPMIADVRVEQEGVVIDEAALLALIETQPGEPLSMREVRNTVAHLTSLNRFEDVQVVEEPVTDGLRLRYLLFPLHPVDRLAFRGTLGLSEQDVRDVVVERFGQAPPAGRVEEVQDALRILYRDRGYPAARIASSIEEAHNPDRATMAFDIVAGTRARVGRVEILSTGAPQGEASRDIAVHAGDAYDEGAIVRTLDRYVGDLRSRGYYEARALHTAEFEPDGSATVRVSVERGPFVIVAFTGDPLPESDRDLLVPVRREGSADEDLLEDAGTAIEGYLRQRGYRDANVTFTREERGDQLTIAFRVMRGPRYAVGAVSVIGQTQIPLAQLTPLYRVERGQPYVQTVVTAGAAAMRDLYRQQGFTRAAVQQTVVEQPAAGAGGERLVDVRFAITEGPRTLVGVIAFEGNAATAESSLRALLATASGRPYSEGDVAADRDRLESAYRDRGFESAVVTPQISFADNGTRADVRFEIREGSQVFVDHVIIMGNRRTNTATIAREVVLRPGEPLGYSARIETQRRLVALGLFRRVVVEDRPHAGEMRRDVLVQVEEAAPTTIGYGGGVEGGTRLRPTGESGLAEERFEMAPRGFFEVGRRNLWGKNRAVNLFTRVSLRSRDITLSKDGVRLERPADGSGYGFNEYRVVGTFREPRVFNTSADVLVTGIVDQAIRSSFNFVRRETRAEAGFRLSQRYSMAGRYSYEHTRLFDERFTEDEKPLIDRLFPQVRLSKFSASFIRDTRSDVIDPTGGTFAIVDSEIAIRAVGSEVGFTKTFLQGFTYYRVPAQRRVVLAFGARLGFAQGFRRSVARLGPDGEPVRDEQGRPVVDVVEDLPASERFFAGGDTTVRGFSLDRLGTAATISPTGFPTGGDGLVVLNAELRTAVVGNLGVVGFLDGGNVFPNAGDIRFQALRAAAGVGLRYQSPVGPIRVDLGFKLDRRELAPGRLERRSVLHISLGQAF